MKGDESLADVPIIGMISQCLLCGPNRRLNPAGLQVFPNHSIQSLPGPRTGTSIGLRRPIPGEGRTYCRHDKDGSQHHPDGLEDFSQSTAPKRLNTHARIPDILL